MVAAALLGVAVSSAPKAQAANLYWDMDTATAGTGGTGSWTNDTSSNWSLTAAGDTAAGAGTFGASDVAFFTGAAGTVTLGGPITIGGLVFSGADFTVTGDTLTLAAASGAPTISVTGGNIATLSSIVTGTSGLTKSGNGVLRLTHASNGYSGITTISGGSLVISSGTALGTDASAISILSANQTPGSTVLYGYGGGALVLDGTAAGFELARNINFEGRGPVGERSAAILSLGNNILSGTLTSAVSPLSPATFRNTRITSVNGTLTLSGTLISQNAGTFIALGGVNSAGVGDFNLSGVLSGPGSITKDGAGAWHLNPSATADFSGTIRIGAGAAGQQSSVRVTQVSVGGTSVFGANVGTNANAAIDMNGGVLEFRADGSLNFSALPSGKNVYLRANSTFYVGPAVGGSSINGITTLGTLRVAANTTGTFNSRNGFGITLQAWTPESFNNPNTITNNMGGLLRFTAGAWGNNDSTARTLTFDGNGNTSVAGSITASAANHILAKGGSGLLTIEGVGSTYLGNTNISAGAIQITDFRSLNNNTAAISLGNATTTAGNLIIGTSVAATAAGLTTSKTITLNTTTVSPSIYANQSGANPVILNGAITRSAQTTGGLILGGTNTADNVVNVAIAVAGTGGLTKVGTGTWVLSAANTYTGVTTVSNGTLKINANAATSTVLPSANALTFGAASGFAGSTLVFVGQAAVNNVQSLGTLNFNGGGASTLRLNPGAGGSASLTFANLSTGGGGTLNIVGADFSTNKVTFTQVNAAAGSDGIVTRSVFWQGADYAFRQGGVVRAPVYGVDAGAATTATGPLTSASNNQITGSFSTNSVSVSTLKVSGSNTLTIDAGQSLTLSGGGLLATGGTSSLTGGTLALGSQILVARVNLLTDVLTVESIITGTGGLTKSGAGTLVISGASSMTGTTEIAEGTVRLSGSGVLSGVNVTTNIRQGAILDLNGVSTGTAIGQFNNVGTVTSTDAATLTVGNNNGAGTSYGVVSGAVSLTKVGTGAQSWLGTSTYTGATTIGSTGLVTVDLLANIGQDSGIGRGDATSDVTNAAGLVFNGSTGGIVYQGSVLNGLLTLGSRSASTNRLFTLAASSTGATLSSTVSNNNAVIWSNAAPVVNNTSANAVLTLTGTSTGDNTFNPQLTDSSVVGIALGLIKTAAGQWNLGNSNNTYTGLTSVSNGVLALNQSGALPANSPVVLGSTTTSGTLQASGTFARNLSATAVAGTGTITWGGTTGGGGFAAHTTSLTVTLNAGAALTWGSGGFVGTGGVQTLFFGSASALADVTFTNPIDFGAAKRTINIVDNGNTGADFATLSGVLSGGAGIGFQKAGSAPLRLTGANSYTGVTDINASALVVTSLGSSAGGATSSVGAGGVAMTDANAVTIGNASTGNAILQHVGPGETSDRKIRINATTGTSAGAQIHADGTGPLILTNVANDMVSNAGSKNLWLRGTSPFLNLITSQLADFGAALNVIVDGGTSWVLTNGTNSYTGTTSVNGGALGIGHNSAISGPLTINNGNVFAHGADRAFGGTLNLANNASSGFYGDYSLTFNGTNNLAAGGNNLNVYNSVAAGKSVTFNGMVANSLTANRAWALEGTGETVINGNFTTSTAFGVRIDKGGDGTLVLGTTGATSNWNQSGAAAVDLDRGTLRFSVSEAIPLTSVVSTVTVVHAGLTISPEVLNADVATVDLNGTTQTINALTATTDGTVVINNTSTSAAAFRFGANDTAVSFGSATGTYSVQNTGSGALSLVKLGNTNVTFGAGIALANKGEIAVEGGIFTVAGPVSAATALRAMGTSALALTGTLSNPQLITSIEVGAGASLGFANGAVSAITGLTSLKLGNTGAGSATLALELGSTANYDRLSTGAAAITGNSVALNLAGIAGFQIGDYDLITAASGLSGATFSLGSVSGALGGFTLALTPSDTLVRLSASANSGTYYWSGSVNSSWGGMSAVGSNFTNDLAGVVNANGIPGAASSVVFSASNQTVTALSITLDSAVSVKDLTFNNQVGTGPTGSIGIAPGTSGALAITPADSTGGINIQAGAPAAITISAPVTLGASQTWTVADVATILASSGGIGGTANLIKSGAGILTLSGTNSYVGTTAIAAGVLQAGAANGFNQTSAHTVSAGAILRLNNFDVTIGSLAGAGTVENAGTANARTITVGGDNSSTSFSGTLQNGGAFGLGLTKVGNGALTLSGANTNTGNITVNGGTLNVTGTWTGNTTSSIFVYGGTNTAVSVANVSADMTSFGHTGSNVTLGIAVYNQTAGTVDVTGNGSTATYIAGAAGSYGYFNLTGGTFKSRNRFGYGVVGNLATPSRSVVYIGGTGRLDHTGGEWMLNYSNAQITLAAGGELDRTGARNPFGLIMNTTTAGGEYAVLNVAGGSLVTTTQPIQFGNSTTLGAGNNNTAIINLAGGTLQVGTAMTTSLPSAGANLAYLNFAGGTLKTSAAIANWIPTSTGAITFTANIFGAIDNSALAGAPSFTGGLTFDTNGFNSSLGAVLRGASGTGVAQSSLTVTGGSNYVGAPEVIFTGGTLEAGGSPATGYALINAGAVVGIVITSPGAYSSAPTVTLTGGGGTGATVSVGTLAANSSGGLTKIGAGTLTLSGANTYAGGTNVNNGTLALGASNVLADVGNVTITGGTLDVATFNDTVATVSLRGGVITGTTGVLTSTTAFDLRNGSVNAILAGSVGLNKTTADTVTLSKANTYSGVTNITGGTLAFSAANNLGDASATNTLTLNGGTLSYTGSGTANLVANQGMTIGSSGATLNTSDATGILNLQGGIVTSAVANLTKTGLGTVTVGLGGSTNLNGGNVTVSAGVLNAGFTASGLGAIAVSTGATLNLYDGSTSTMAINGLTLAAGSSLGFDLGATGINDVLSLTGTAAIAPSVSLNFNALGTLGAASYDLLSVSAGTLNAADYVLGLAPSGLNYNFTTTNAGQTLRLTTSLLNLVYWKGDVVGGSWSANNAADTNWASDLAGTTDLGALPIATDTLVFSATSAVGPTYVTTLDGSFSADSLKFTDNPVGVTAVSINQGSSGTLTLSPASANNGISVPANAGAITIGAPIATGATQTWEVVGGGANGSSLTVSGAVTIGHVINKAGAGVLTLSGSNTGSGGLVLAVGTLIIANANALGAGAFSIGAGTILDTGATAILNAGNNAQNWNGNFTFTGTNTLNLGTGAVTLGDNVIATVSAQTLTVGGAIGDGVATFGLTKLGAGALTLNGANTLDGGVTLAAGTLNLGHANALGDGMLTFNGGTLDNSSGGALTLGGSGGQTWNTGFTFLGTHDLATGSGAVTLATNIPVDVTAGNLTVNGVIDDGLNTFNLEKTGAGTLTLGALNTFGGATIISAGTLAFTANQTLAAATNTLLFGASAASTTVGNLVLTADATFGGAMIVNTNSATASQISIGSGKTLTLNANVQIGATTPLVNGTVTKLTLNGGGVFNVTTAAAGTFVVGGSTAAISQDATLDLTALASTTINTSATGTLRVNPSSATNIAGAKATLLLPAPVVADTVATSTITAGTIAVGNTGLFASQAGQINTIRLGTGLTTLNANTINVGTGARDLGQIIFGQAGGDLKIRAADGTSRATLIAIGTGGASTGTSDPATNNLVDFSAHDADVLVATLNVGNQARTGNLISEFKFGAGDSSLASVLDVTSVNIGFRTGTATATSILTNRVHISGGAVTFGNGAGTGTGVKVGSSTYDQAGAASTIGELNISGGTVVINNSTALAAAVQLGDNVSAGGGTVTAAMNLTGGTTTLGGHIIRSATSLRTTSTVTLNGAGAILDMGGKNIGSASALITFNAQAGTLRNLAQLNGGGVLTKSTTGTLLLDTANAFTGGVTLSAAGGKVIVGHNNALGSGTITLNSNTGLELADGITLSNAFIATFQGNAKTIMLQSGATSATYSGSITNSEEVAANFELSASAGGTLTVSGIISGGDAAAGFEKMGAGIVILSGANTYTGVTTVSAGKLTVSSLGDGVSASSLGTAGLDSANLIFATGVTLGYVGAGETSARGFTMSSDATLEASGTGALAFSSAAKVAFSNSTATRSLTLDGTSTAANSFGAGLSVGGTLDADKINLIVKNGVGTWIIANGETLKKHRAD
jgi:autotransporter-associated beta strand protein